MDKGLLIYKIDSNKFYLDQQDKELTYHKQRLNAKFKMQLEIKQ